MPRHENAWRWAMGYAFNPFLSEQVGTISYVSNNANQALTWQRHQSGGRAKTEIVAVWSVTANSQRGSGGLLSVPRRRTGCDKDLWTQARGAEHNCVRKV